MTRAEQQGSGYVSVQDLEHSDATRADAAAGRWAGPPYGGLYPPKEAGRWMAEAIGRAEELGVPGRLQVQWVLGQPRQVLVGGYERRLPCCTQDHSGSRPMVAEHINYNDETQGPSEDWLWLDWQCGGCGRVPEPVVWHSEPVMGAGLSPDGSELFVAPAPASFAERAMRACDAAVAARMDKARLAAETLAERLSWALEAGLPVGSSAGAVLFCAAEAVAERLEEAQRANDGLGVGGLGAGLDGEAVVALTEDAAAVCAVVDRPAAAGRFEVVAEPVAEVGAGRSAGRWAGALLAGAALAEIVGMDEGSAKQELRREWTMRSFDASTAPPERLWTPGRQAAEEARAAMLEHVGRGLPIAQESFAAARRAGVLSEVAAVDGGLTLG